MLSNELTDIGQLISCLPPDPETGQAAKLLNEISRACSHTKKAWNEVLFSNAGEQQLKRYCQFHVLNLSEMLEARPAAILQEAKEELIKLLDYLHQYYTGYFPNEIGVPKAYQQHWLQQILPDAQYLKESLEKTTINIRLRTCLLGYIGKMINCTRHTYQSIYYFRKFLAHLTTLNLADSNLETLLEEKLYELNFNNLSYYNYQKRKLQTSAAGQPWALCDQQLQAIWHLPDIKQEKQNLSYHPEWPSLEIMLTTLLSETLANQSRQNQGATNLKAARTHGKLPLNISVAHLACLLRLFYDEGLLAEQNLTNIFRFIAHNYQTKRQGEISPGSLSKEFYSIDQKTAAVVRDKLSKMIARLNRDFFPA